jgi:hypothetical protein
LKTFGDWMTAAVPMARTKDGSYFPAYKLVGLYDEERQQIRKMGKGDLFCVECGDPVRPKFSSNPLLNKPRPHFAHHQKRKNCNPTKESLSHMNLKSDLKFHFNAHIPDEGDNPFQEFGICPDAIIGNVVIEGQTQISGNSYSLEDMLNRNKIYWSQGYYPLWIVIKPMKHQKLNNLEENCLLLQGFVVQYDSTDFLRTTFYSDREGGGTIAQQMDHKLDNCRFITQEKIWRSRATANFKIPIPDIGQKFAAVSWK